MQWADTMGEAQRTLGICNVCNYCNGFCDVFEAAQRRPALTETDVMHLANLCHHCRNCFHACQYAPPHPFSVNVPRSLARVRHRIYARFTWPAACSGVFDHSVSTTLLIGLGATAVVCLAVLATVAPEMLFGRQLGAGAFYRIVPWGVMTLLALLTLGWSVLAMSIGLRRYWRVTSQGMPPVAARAIGAALRDALTLRNLRGGGPGCNDLDDRASPWRRRLHQALLFGLLLTFAATAVATLFHHLLGWQAPYPVLSPPVLLGTLGGIAISLAAPGLAWLNWRADAEPSAAEMLRADNALLALLFAVAVSGLALLAGRGTGAMGILLALHLGTVFACFLLLPYGKFVHAGYRLAALLQEAMERQPDPQGADLEIPAASIDHPQKSATDRGPQPE